MISEINQTDDHFIDSTRFRSETSCHHHNNYLKSNLSQLDSIFTLFTHTLTLTHALLYSQTLRRGGSSGSLRSKVLIVSLITHSYILTMTNNMTLIQIYR